MIRNTSLNAIELQTILTEIEATLNSRPLTYLYTDINDDPPLTPSQFLYGHRLLTLPGTEEDSDYINKEKKPLGSNYHATISNAFRNESPSKLNEIPKLIAAARASKCKMVEE